MSIKIQFEIRCFDRDLIILLEDQSDIGRAHDIMYEAYNDWCDGAEQCGDMCCEEYIIDCLKEAEIKFRSE